MFRLEETVGELTRQAVLDRRRYDRTHALLTLAMLGKFRLLTFL